MKLTSEWLSRASVVFGGMISAYMRPLCLLLFAVPIAAAAAGPRTEIDLWVSRDVAPSAKIRVNINTRNLPVVHASVYSIDGIGWLKRFEEDRTKRPQAAGAPIRQWDVTVAKPADRRLAKDVYYSRQTNLPPLNPGVYLLSVTGGGREAWKVVNVTHLALVSKRSPRRILTWVTDAITGKVVTGATVQLFDRAGKQVAAGRTGSDGVALFPIKPGRQSLVVRRGTDHAGIGSYGNDPDGLLRPHFQTDRPVYRPGQKGSFKIILRRTLGQGYVPVADTDFAVKLVDPKGNAIDKATLHTNANGTAAGSFDLPEEGALGSYSIQGMLGKEPLWFRFEVLEYRKPEFQVTAKPVAKRYLAGEEAAIDVDAQLYFGAPVPQAQVGYTVERAPNYLDEYASDGSYDGNLDASDTYRSPAQVATGTVFTDKDGKVRIKFTTDKAAPDSVYSVALTVQDASRRQVEGSASVPVYAASLRIGLSTDLLLAPLGTLVPVRVRAQDLDGKPCPAKVELTLVKYVWDEKKGLNKRVLVTSLVAAVPPTGNTVVNVPAKAQGDLWLEAVAKDPTGRKTKAGLGICVAGPFDKAQRETQDPEVDVKLDRRTYDPGQAVKAYVTTNQKNRPMLVVLEGADIWKYLVVPAGNRSKLWGFKTSAAMSPNAFVDVNQWAKNQPISGETLVPIPDKSRRIAVAIDPNKTDYRPGDKADYKVTATDSKGRPVAAEVALSVIDAAIYAIRPDTTADLYQSYWGQRDNQVTTRSSAPEEMSGGAYQRNESALQAAKLPAMAGFSNGISAPRKVAAARTRFEDTAYWNAFVETGPDGQADITFEVPGNLTAWKAVARGVTKSTAVGSATATVRANRPVMLRLATPRQMVQGDEITLIGTIDNRTPDEHEFEVTLAGKDVVTTGAATQKVRVPGKGQEKVEWVLRADQLPATGSAQLEAQIVSLDVPAEQSEEYSDALRVPLRIVPKGVEERLIVGGVVSDATNADLDLPADRIEGAGKVTITVWAGFQAALQEAADSVLKSYRYGSTGASAHLAVSAAMGKGADDKEIRESMAMLAKLQSAGGWGWWEDAPVDPVVTARVMSDIGYARLAGVTIYERLLQTGRADVIDLYKRTNLWEHRALLASAGVLAEDPSAGPFLDEIVERGELMSPYARLKTAEALWLCDKKDAARKMLDDVLKDASDGPAATYIPCGDGIGWSATDVETTAQCLATLVRMSEKPDLQPKLARWLVMPARNWWRCEAENAAVVRALRAYLDAHPEAKTLGPVEIEVAGHKVTATPSKVAMSATAQIPIEWLKTGSNSVAIRRSEPGEAFFTVEAPVFKPGLYENVKGIRVLRRFEVRNAAGIWVELLRPVKPSEPVRCTVVVWGDDVGDAMKIVEPIPAGFEYIESEAFNWGREEVRDGAIVHYLVNGAQPQTFRYYLRAESEGRLVALPATGEYLRRPSNRGQTAQEPIEVRK